MATGETRLELGRLQGKLTTLEDKLRMAVVEVAAIKELIGFEIENLKEEEEEEDRQECYEGPMEPPEGK